MAYCSNCGLEIEQGKRFCRHCGAPAPADEEAPTSQLQQEPAPEDEPPTWRLPSDQAANLEPQTWRLPQDTAQNPEPQRPTMPVAPGQTAPQGPAPGNPYMPPVNYYQPPPPPVPYRSPASSHSGPNLGDWLSRGWDIYKENWLLMSLATLLGGILSLITFGVLAGPMLMGLYRMAFKTMRQDRPELGDLFRWEGRFLQAFLAFLIFAAIYIGFTAGGRGDFLFALGFVVINPILTITLAFVMPLILERNMDVAPAINSVWRMLFSRDKLMWWVVGLVLFFINFAGGAACGIGFLLTLPWTVSAAASAYNDVYGIDDPNRTLH